MTNLIKEIRKIIGDNDYNYIDIHICYNEIWLDIYETGVVIAIDLKKREVYVDCETLSNKLSWTMLDELSKIVKLLEDNLDIIDDLLKLE